MTLGLSAFRNALSDAPTLAPSPTFGSSPPLPVSRSAEQDASPSAFRAAFRQAAAAVWVVTAVCPITAQPVGFTAISVVSVSLEPTLLSFNISKTSSSLHAVRTSGRFAVHLLGSSDGSIDLARLFAAKPASNRFQSSRHWRWDDRGLPDVQSAVTRMVGTVEAMVEAGDSWLVIGRVEAIDQRDDPSPPLVHVQGGYRMLPKAEKPSATTATAAVSPLLPQAAADSSSVPTTAGVRSASGVSAGDLPPPSAGSKAARAPRRRMYLNAFDMSCVGHQSPGVWTHPQDESHRYKELSYWTSLARVLERGHFDTLFIADVLGTYDVYRGNRHTAVTHGTQVPVNEPTLAIPAMAAVTKRLGFAATISLSYEQPYSLARRLSTLDHLTGGRIAWNVVTGYLNSAAVNLGLTKQMAHDERYNMADEFMDVCYKLWEGSWDDDAVIRDKRRRIFALPEKVHDIGHKGRYFSVPGAHLCEPSPQRTPVIFQAGASGRGQAFAAKHAEAVFLIAVNTRHLASLSASIRKQAVAEGRDPYSIKIFALLTPVVGRTDEEAAAKFAEYRSYASSEGALALYGGWTGIDLSTVDPHAPLEYAENDSLRSVGEMFRRSDPNKVWTAAEVADFLCIGGIGPVLVGSAQRVADEMERWMDEADIDGFNIAYALTPGTFVDFADLVVPELRKRGRRPSTEEVAAEAEGLTLRERMGGQAKLPADHPGAAYRGAFGKHAAGTSATQVDDAVSKEQPTARV